MALTYSFWTAALCVHGPGHRTAYDRVNVDPATRKLAAEGAEVILMCNQRRIVQTADKVLLDWSGHLSHLEKNTALSASTFRKLPVDLVERS